jgi:rhombotail lipoprotein
MNACAVVRRIGVALLLGLLVAAATGCAGARSRYNSSVVDYLYPDKKDPVAQSAIPVLHLPMRVGIAFVPASEDPSYRSGLFERGRATQFALTEARKSQLMEQVAGHFRSLDFIKSIEIIPSAYLTPRGSFANLDQVRSMYGIDAIGLLSYDQTQFTDQDVFSVTYWTIVGAYVIPGEKNDTHTMVDAVVMHIPSQKMLFRAPGISHIKGRSTPVNLSEELRTDSDRGFEEAVKAMITNLDQQLTVFQERVKSAPQEYEIVRAAGYKGGGRGGGALNEWLAIFLTLLMVGGWFWSRPPR